MSLSSRISDATNFRKIQNFSIEYSPAIVTQYESTRTGMRIVVVDQEGPKVSGYFTLATEIHDDSGAPHTLEHLCFLGSKSYRYKGFLDKLATRAYSTTNAWTATDHTAYTLYTAGWEGFAQILPVYLEHLILPTLTDSGCYTEVHHVDGSGNDAGVVYSEMQGFESNLEYLMHWKYKRMLYPEGVGFRYETGGRLEQLRTLTAERIREFHREMYQPKNLCLVITGTVDHASLLEILDDFEGTILDDIPKLSAPFKRPWVESKQVPPLATSSIETMEFPEEDESSGDIWISFFGPNFNDHLLCGAMVVLLIYLASSSASILVNTMVEKEQLAGAVAYEIEFRPNIVIQFFVTSVATEKLEQVETRFFEVLRDAAAKPIDLEYMRDCIKRERRREKFAAESSDEHFSDPIIKDFLFGERDGSTLQADLENLKDYETLETWTDRQWRYWLKAWLTEAPHATVLGKPSAKLSKKLKSEEKARVSSQKEQLGREGLKHLQKKLDAARAQNEVEVPTNILEQFEVPSTNSIHFINTTTARSGAARKMGSLDNHIQSIVDRDIDLPLFIHFENVQSSFAHLNLILGTEVVPVALRPMLAIYMEIFFTTPMLRDGRIIDFEHIVMELERDTAGYDIESGQGIGNSEVIVIKLQVEVENYQKAIRWFKDLLRASVFDIERIKATTSAMVASIPDEKRDGEEMMSAVELMTGTAPRSFGRACGSLTRAVYLKRVKYLLEHDPEVIVNKLEGINTALCQVSNFRVLVIANIQRLERPVSSWETLLEGLDTSVPLKPLDTRLSRLSQEGESPGNIAFVVPLPTIDSSYAMTVSKGPSSWTDPHIPALMVATSYLNAVEGPLWTAIRGTGLAYGSSFYQHVDSGQVSLMVWTSPDASKAFIAGKDAVQHLVSGQTKFDPLAVEGAVSAIVLNFANADATMASAAQSSFVRQVMRSLPKDWPNVILEKVRKVTVEEIKKVMRDIILPLFDTKTSNLFVICAPIMERKMVKGFGEVGFKTDVKPLAFFQDDYGLKVGEGLDEEEEEEENSDDDEDVEGGDDEDEGEDEGDNTEAGANEEEEKDLISRG